MWPEDHPAITDDALVVWSDAATDLCPDGRFIRLLRYLPGRRAASLVDTRQGLAVLKVFASPRARGNDRRLRLLADTPVRDQVPRTLGVDDDGHVSLVSWREGTIYDEVDDDQFVAAAHQVGEALHALHNCGALFDREWTIDREALQLRRRATPATAAAADEVIAATVHVTTEPLVPAHRDCHPRQVVCVEEQVFWIDLDDAAMAPAALDIGNMVAHLRRDACLGRRDRDVTDDAITELRRGYGPVAGDVDGWTRLALVRLAGLAESRHHQPDDRQQLLALCAS